jgi:hypothetical protein
MGVAIEMKCWFHIVCLYCRIGKDISFFVVISYVVSLATFVQVRRNFHVT